MYKVCTKRIALGIFVIINTLLYFPLNAHTETKLDSYFRYMPSRSVDAMSGKIEIIEADAEYSYELKAFDKLPFKFSLGNKYIGIENTTPVELPGQLVGVTPDIETTLPFFNVNNTHLRLGLSPSFFGDDWNFSTSEFRIPMRSFLIYQPTDQWTFLAGLAIYPEFENEVWPLLGFIYKPNDKFTFNIVPKRPNISYFLNNKITLFAEGGAQFFEFEVTKDNFKNVVLCYRQIHLGVGIKYKVNNFIRSSLAQGMVFNRYLKYRDGLGKVGIEDGIYTEFRIEIDL